jgi:alanine racemase
MALHPLRIARISSEGLAANIAGVTRNSRLVDISGNAYGHGGLTVARIAIEVGAGLWVSTDDDVTWLRGQGLRHPVSCGATELAAALDEVYGFDGVAAPVMTLTGHVLLTKDISQGDGVSYGYTFRAPTDGRTALISLGYGDGIHRRAGNVCSAHVGGVRYPIVGRVAMNVLVLFLGTDSVDVGAEVVIFGDPAVGHPSLLEWSARLGEEPLAVTSGLTDRVERMLS